jgi:hypothetical protein
MKKEAVANKVIRKRIIPFLRKHITDDEFTGAAYKFPASKAAKLIINNREPSFRAYGHDMKYADLNSPIHERYGFKSKEDLLDAYRREDNHPRGFADDHRKKPRRMSFPGAEFVSYLEPYANATIRRKRNGLSRYNTLLSRDRVLNRTFFDNPVYAPVYPLTLGNSFPSEYGRGAVSDAIAALSGSSVSEDIRFPLLHTFTARRPFMRTPHLADAPTSKELNDYGRRTNSGASRVADAVDPSRVTYKRDNANNPVEWATGRQLSEDELNALFDTNQHYNPWYEMVEDVGPHLPVYTGSYTPITEDNIKLFKDYGVDLLSKKQLPLKDIQGRTDFNLYKGTPVVAFTPIRYELSGGAKLRDAMKRRLDSYNTDPQTGLLSRMFSPFRSLWRNLTSKKSLSDRPRIPRGTKNYDSEFIQQLNDPQRPLMTPRNLAYTHRKDNVIANALPDENLEAVRAWPEGDPLWFTNSIGVGAAHIKGTGLSGWKEPWVNKDFMYAALDPEDIVKITSTTDPVVRKFDLDSLPEGVVARLIKEQDRNSFDKALLRHDRAKAVSDAVMNTPQHIKDEYAFYDNLRDIGASGRRRSQI